MVLTHFGFSTVRWSRRVIMRSAWDCRYLHIWIFEIFCQFARIILIKTLTPVSSLSRTYTLVACCGSGLIPWYLCGTFERRTCSDATERWDLYFYCTLCHTWAADNRSFGFLCIYCDILPCDWGCSCLLPQVMSSSTLMTFACLARRTPMWSNFSSLYRSVRAWPSCSVEGIPCPSTPRTQAVRPALPWRPLGWSTARWWWMVAAAMTRTWSTCRWAPSFLVRLWPRLELPIPETHIWTAHPCRPPRPARHRRSHLTMTTCQWPLLGLGLLPGQQHKGQSC